MRHVRIQETFGTVYGRLTVLGISMVIPKWRGRVLWLCSCDHGGTRTPSLCWVPGIELRRKRPKGTRSCGCLFRECQLAKCAAMNERKRLAAAQPSARQKNKEKKV